MQKNTFWVVLVLVAVVIGGFYVLNRRSSSELNMISSPKASTIPSESAMPASTTKSGTSQSFTVNADDSSADLTTINVKKGTPVSITFSVKANNVYHGGLDFRSSQISTGPIIPGRSKTISFTATSSFAFTPYWPSSNIAKPYSISVVVQ